MEYKNNFKLFILLALGTLAFYLIFTNHYTTILQSLQISFINSFTIDQLFFGNISISNETNDSVSTRELLSLQKPFESRLSDYHPHLSIHIYTQNLSL